MPPTYRPQSNKPVNYSVGGKKGVAGSAVLFGTAGLYLVYVGTKDIPFFEGLRSLLRKEKPTGISHEAYQALQNAGQIIGAAAVSQSGDTGIEKLVGSAAAAYPKLKSRFPSVKMGGWRATGSVDNSDHPKGKAIDAMTSNPAEAEAIISAFKQIAGAKYFIWNRQIGAIYTLWARRYYNGPSPHTDHVHMSFY